MTSRGTLKGSVRRASKLDEARQRNEVQRRDNRAQTERPRRGSLERRPVPRRGSGGGFGSEQNRPERFLVDDKMLENDRDAQSPKGSRNVIFDKRPTLGLEEELSAIDSLLA